MSIGNIEGPGVGHGSNEDNRNRDISDRENPFLKEKTDGGVKSSHIPEHGSQIGSRDSETDTPPDFTAPEHHYNPPVQREYTPVHEPQLDHVTTKKKSTLRKIAAGIVAGAVVSGGGYLIGKSNEVSGTALPERPGASAAPFPTAETAPTPREFTAPTVFEADGTQKTPEEAAATIRKEILDSHLKSPEEYVEKGIWEAIQVIANTGLNPEAIKQGAKYVGEEDQRGKLSKEDLPGNVANSERLIYTIAADLFSEGADRSNSQNNSGEFRNTNSLFGHMVAKNKRAANLTEQTGVQHTIQAGPTGECTIGDGSQENGVSMARFSCEGRIAIIGGDNTVAESKDVTFSGTLLKKSGERYLSLTNAKLLEK